MFFELNKDNGIPLYIQIESRLTQLIHQGILKPLERLPATRELSDQLNVHRNTVVQAYRELEVKGFVFSEVGRGTFVNKYIKPESHRETFSSLMSSAQFSYDGLYSDNWISPEDITMTTIENIVRTCHKPKDVIAFSSVVPDKNIFPLREFQNCTYHTIQKYGVDLLEMGDTQGFRPFLEYLPKFFVRRGMTVHSDDIIIVSGIQQGIDLISRLLLNPGDTVVTEELTYRGALRIFRSLGVNVIGIPADRQGMRTDVLETILERQKIKMIYTIPTFQNPTGTVMPLERRKQLLELAQRYQIPIIEDQYANELRLDGEEVLPLAALDKTGQVIVLGSFSKILFHGIRLGWVVAPNKGFFNKLCYAKRITDWQNNYLIQGAILEFCERGYFDKYLKKKLKILKERRDAMYEASRNYFPEEVFYERACGGLFEWAELPPELNAYELLMETRQRSVLFTPKRFFSAHADDDNGMRLGYVSYEPSKIAEGMRILGEYLKRAIAVQSNTVVVSENIAPVI
ncbi:PLP-dependent aminotransferase family protein [bacterium]|nr:PLP-dependent aminotransferase family protein [bacterium]